jgi:hypothetical protein
MALQVESGDEASPQDRKKRRSLEWFKGPSLAPKANTVNKWGGKNFLDTL